MNIEFSSQEAALLRSQLGVRVHELERDLVRTDKADLQHALAREVEALRAIEHRLARALADGSTGEEFV